MPQQRIPAIDPGDGLGLLAALQDNAVTARQINARDGNIRMIEDVEQFPWMLSIVMLPVWFGRCFMAFSEFSYHKN